MKLREKTTAILLVVLLTSMAFGIAPILAVKPAGNLAGAEKVLWNLSGDVMPVPPYGTRDIPGSDDASKLIVNQPNGALEVVITGVMNGLTPDAVYTVILSKGYTSWSLAGDWKLEFDLGGTIYPHDMSITEETYTTFSGTGTNSDTWVVTGTKDGTKIEMVIDYDHSETYFVDVIGTIDTTDGSISGTWTAPSQSGTWESIEGAAIEKVGTSFPGDFTIPRFTFTPDDSGSYSWHLNLRDSDFPRLGTHTLSVWINEGGKTILISDNFEVTVD